jgi:amidase
MVPIAHGNDGGGSLRIPAACCGLVGLKPQRHRVSSAPEIGASALVVDGVLTRTVAETAALLDVLAGREIGDAAWSPPGEGFASAAARPPGALRIAFTSLPPIPDIEVDPRSVQATTHAATLLASLGHAVEEVTPPWQSDDVADLFGDYFAAHVAVGIYFATLAAGGDKPAASDMEPLSWALWKHCQQMSAVQFQVLQTRLQARMRALVSFLADYDALLTPALAQRPLPLGTLDAAAPYPLRTFARSGHFTPFTPIFNASGQPAISLPLCHGDDGLPLGVQIAGAEGGEGVLLALAAQLEAAEPWIDRRPPLMRDPAPAPSLPASRQGAPGRASRAH